MNKKQIFRATGALLLVVAGAFAGRASSKKAAATALYYTKGTPGCIQLASSVSTSILTTGSSKTQAALKTSNGANFWNLYSTANCGATHRVHFNG